MQALHDRMHTIRSIKSVFIQLNELEGENHARRKELFISLLEKTRLETLCVDSRQAERETIFAVTDALYTQELRTFEVRGIHSSVFFWRLARKGLPKLAHLEFRTCEDTRMESDMESVSMLSPIPTLRTINLNWEDASLLQSQYQLCIIKAICSKHIVGSLAITVAVTQLEADRMSWQTLDQELGVHITSIHIYSDSFPIGSANMDLAFPNLKTFRLNTDRLAFDHFTMPTSVSDIEFNLIACKLGVPVRRKNLLKLADLKKLRTLSIACNGMKAAAFHSYARLHTACERNGIQMTITPDMYEAAAEDN